MDHVAIDIGGRESQICVRAANGQIIEETRCSTRSVKKFLAKRAPSRVVMETCAEAFGLADGARATGHEVTVVPAMLVRSLGVGQRGLKNDVRDARNLSAASCRMEELPSVHIPSTTARERKSMCGMREGLVGARTALINTVRGWLRGQCASRPATGRTETFGKRVREHLARQGLAMPAFVERQLAAIEFLDKQILEADQELETMAGADEVCRRLMTVPGVGPVVSVRFASALDEVGRFDDAHALESYLGLTPGEDSSSDKMRTTSITKAGAVQVRWALVQAAWVFRRVAANHPGALWAMEVERRRGKRIAVVALARKLAGILYAIWRDGTTYNPLHKAQRPTG
jgi:transposase